MTHTWKPDLLCAEQTIALSPEMILCVRDETNEFKKNNILEISNEKWKLDTRFFFILLLLLFLLFFVQRQQHWLRSSSACVCLHLWPKIKTLFYQNSMSKVLFLFLFKWIFVFCSTDVWFDVLCMFDMCIKVKLYTWQKIRNKIIGPL